MLCASTHQQVVAARSRAQHVVRVTQCAAHAVPSARGSVKAVPGVKHIVDRASRTITASANTETTQHAAAGGSPAPKAHRVVLKVADKEIILETGEIGRQANGAIMATMGETMLYTTACCSNSSTGDGTFVPLTVNYQERFSAAGKTSGGYIKREGRPRDADVLVARLVDRPIRPMFTKGWSSETQVLQWVMSYDGTNTPEALAITAASASLLVSDIPFEKAVAGVRVGWVDGRPVVNPTAQQQADAANKLDLVVAGTRDAVLMIEGFCEFLTEDQMIEAVGAGAAAIAEVCKQLEAWAAVVGKPKRRDLVKLPEGLEEAVEAVVGPVLTQVYSRDTTKAERSAVEGQALETVKALLAAEGPKLGVKGDITPALVQLVFKGVSSKVMRSVTVEQGRRLDGRGLRDIRPISSRAGVLPRTHGSVLFTRGETQALCVATLGSKQDAQRTESIRGEDEGQSGAFYLQYHFPPSSVGEVGRTGAPGRRELGHGELAQRALAPVVPSAAQDWGYTVRVESTITESNGSSSMASVCGGCLAMLDAGVPLTRPVAGIAMGLILEPSGKYVVLSDILGTEDALGDMDFKVAGDADTLTAFQMDIKVEGITLDIMRAALAQARDGRRHILGEMEKCSPAPRRDLSPYAPRVVRKPLEASKIGAVIGAGGRVIKAITEITGASVNVSDAGVLEVMAPNAAALERAVELCDLAADPPPTGKVFRGVKVSGVQAFGAFVELGPGREGLVHVSELMEGYVADATTVIKVGEMVDVVVLDSRGGKTSLSRKALLPGGKASSTPAAAGAGSGAAGNGEKASPWYDGADDVEVVGEGGSETTPKQGAGVGGGRGGRGAGRGGYSGGGGRGGGGRGAGRGDRAPRT